MPELRAASPSRALGFKGMTVSILRAQRGELPLAEQYFDYTVFQTEPWINFLQETQGAEPVYAKVILRERIIGRFVGLVVRKFGVPILGSPMRGWTTSYMGFNLEEHVSRLDVLQALVKFCFRELKCLHLEISDRNFGFDELIGSGYKFHYQSSFEIAGIFPAANRTMYFWGGASWRAHQHLRPNQILHWAAMMYWKARGMTRYDMGGGGDYKRQYGGRQIAAPWVMVSKYPGLHSLRSCARFAWSLRQRASGLVRTLSRELRERGVNS